ncbi:hypothetical protein I2483_19135, partial [Sporosarcina sp. E16_3]|nr:hypothetical protein [Sporosarcina sp. E16_3]
YTVPISIIKNGTVEAKGQNSEGEWSEIGSISLNNIDKTAPDISLSASPTTLTATDVTITADIRDLDNELFKTPESTSTIQTHTFSIPGLKMLNGAKANTGNAEIVNVDGEKVTVKVSGGNPSRKVETGGSYTPEDTKYVEGQTSSSYNSGGYVGNLLQYVYSGSYTPSHSIEVTGQSSSYYNSGGYSGTLSQYYYGPGPSSLRLISSNHGYGQDHSGMSGNGQYFYECNPSNGNPQGGWFCKLYEVIPGEPIYKYRGTVTKPASDNRVYRYQGNVTKPATDTRTYEDRFQYEISLDYERVVPVQKWTKGNQIVEFFKNAGVELNGTTFTVSENDTYTVYAEDTAGNESIETINISNIDKKPITPILSASPITPT